MTVIPRQTKTKMNPADYMFTATPEEHAKAVVDQFGWESKTYGPLMHDLEYNLRFVYSFGLFDSFVQYCNKNRSEKMIKIYENNKNIRFWNSKIRYFWPILINFEQLFLQITIMRSYYFWGS